MAFKQFALDEQTSVTIYKRRANRSLRLSIASDGAVRVSIPTWAPYRAGLEFARSRHEWIRSQQQPTIVLTDGQAVGKAHRLRFAPDAAAKKISSRVKPGEVVVTHPLTLASTSAEVQAVATTAAIRALRGQAEQLLPQRLAKLAELHDFSYESVAIKQLRGRWGSCDQHTHIVLNLFLMQLPWDLIDYVLLHELTHTKALKHGPSFWQAMAEVLPDVNARKKAMRDYKPVLVSPPAELMA